MAEERVSDTGIARDHTCHAFSAREWAMLAALPWFLAVVVSVCSPERDPGGVWPLATVVCAAVLFVAMALGSVLSPPLGTLAVGPRALRAGMISVAAGALSLPGLIAVVAGYPVWPGHLPFVALFLAVTAYACLQAGAVAGAVGPPATALWMGAPPFLFYLVLDVFAVRAEGLLLASPASGAVRASASGYTWTAFPVAAVVPALAGAVLSVLPSAPRAGLRVPRAEDLLVSLDSTPRPIDNDEGRA